MSAEADLTTRLGLYLAAEAAILSGAQEYTVGQGSTARKLTRGDLAAIQSEIRSIRVELNGLTPGRRRGVVYLRPNN